MIGSFLLVNKMLISFIVFNYLVISINIITNKYTPASDEKFIRYLFIIDCDVGWGHLINVSLTSCYYERNNVWNY